MRQIHRVTVVAVVLVTMLAGSALAVGQSNIRDGWMYGLNLGWGWTQVKAHDMGNNVDLETRWSDDFTGALRVAFAPSETFAYGLDFSGWQEYTWLYSGESLKTKVFYFMLQGHWFPGGQGFYLRGGLGAGSLGLTYRDLVTVTKSAGGFCWGVGAGWEARVTQSFAIGVVYDYRSINVGEYLGVLDNTQAATQSATLSLTWYSF